MQTYSHLLTTGWIGDRLRRRGTQVRLGALLLGSVLPDVPLLLLTLVFFLRNGAIGFGPAYDALFFRDPFWVASHNLLHAPFVIAALAWTGWYVGRAERGWGVALLWFAAGCTLHTLCDVATHHDDGPLLLFPFGWSFRFSSPISYWNPAYHGRLVGGIEHLLDAAILLYFAVTWWRRKTAKDGAGEPATPLPASPHPDRSDGSRATHRFPR